LARDFAAGDKLVVCLGDNIFEYAQRDAVSSWDDGAVVFVEWPEAAGDGLPPVRVRAGLAYTEPGRVIDLQADEKSLLERIFSGAGPRV